MKFETQLVRRAVGIVLDTQPKRDGEIRQRLILILGVEPFYVHRDRLRDPLRETLSPFIAVSSREVTLIQDEVLATAKCELMFAGV